MRWWKGLLTGVVLIALIVAGSYGYWRYRMQAPIALDHSLIFEVSPGSGARQVIDRLAEQGVIRYRWPYQVLAILEPRHVRQLRAGEFQLQPGMNGWQLLAKLSSNDIVTYELTIPEGWTLDRMRQRIDQAPKLTHETRGMNDEALMKALGHGDQKGEGRFFPSTYRYHKGTSDLDIYQRAYARMKKELEQAWARRSDDLPLDTPYQALILASLIERETGAPEERPRIAGVFVRRLERGMRLQTDPSVIYGLGKAYDGSLSRADLEKATAYNTYVINGLPPTPIALPGRASLRAAVNPASGDSLYFVAKGNGQHHFSATLREHNAAVQRYILNK
ncbi:endolytic transglycosylase MltG [Kushneria phosphatilytica]|uniref:Endolytic murein transglycosylase n=1 Tax=Kushneria phosphatilytica TaxID=657387 RepID=A0A1S1NWJ8_9GAMM|nr:endolytic transglycosylase MltG [Kushneria phosphatilytica]OHV11808.1 BCR, YceG family protein [Kushneria phosphatilytica]QEL10973.1 endolytic transglycosylase MltG [Kushneria phosphatilytica]